MSGGDTGTPIDLWGHRVEPETRTMNLEVTTTGQADKAVHIVAQMGARLDLMQAAAEKQHKRLNALGVPRGGTVSDRLKLIESVTLKAVT